MKLIIDISEDDYKEVVEDGINHWWSLTQAIRKGMRLPKEHWWLIDAIEADEVKK